MISRTRTIAAASIVAAVVATTALSSAQDAPPLQPAVPFDERALVERRLLLLRIDPKRGAAPETCGTLHAGDLRVSIGDVAANVTSVERVPRPARHWLLLDNSNSAEGRRTEAKRSAREYVRAVITPPDTATLVTIDDDVILGARPLADPTELVAGIDEISAGGTSALRDGLETILRQVQGDRHEQLILFWTDGQDTMSVGTLEDLLATIGRAPHATIFPIVMQPVRASDALRPPAGTFLFEVARRSGGEVLGSSDPRWLDRVRGWIGRRFTVSVAYPEGAGDAPVVVTLRDRRCVATLLRDPFALPDPVAGAAPPPPAAWVRLHAKQRNRDDPACASTTTSASWEWPWRSVNGVLSGCVLDPIRSPGRFVARDVRVLAPNLAALPHSLDEAIETVLPTEGRSSPYLVSGAALLADRARIAASLFADRRDYRDFALARLSELAADDLLGIERDLARDHPDLAAASIDAIARASRAGRRGLDAARTPTDADLARVLAAWLADVPARSVFSSWEMRLIDARIARGRDPSVEAKWTALRSQLSNVDDTRIVAPLILIKDPKSNLIGFNRIVLPRRRGAAVPLEDVVPGRPLGLLLVDRVGSSPSVCRRLLAGGYRTISIVEEPALPLWRSSFGDPFRSARVTVTLESPGATARVVLEGEVHTDDAGTVTIARPTRSVTGDPELAELLRD